MNSNQQKFEELFKEHFNSDIYHLIDNYDYGYSGQSKNLLNLELVSDETTDISDSYDYTDELLEKVFYHKELDLYIKFKGRNQSYEGTDWDGYSFVTPKTKEIKIYE